MAAPTTSRCSSSSARPPTRDPRDHPHFPLSRRTRPMNGITLTSFNPEDLPDNGGMSRVIQALDLDTDHLLKLPLRPPDLHIDLALSNYATGYRNGDMIADKVSAPVLVGNASNYFFQFHPDNALATVDGTQVA